MTDRPEGAKTLADALFGDPESELRAYAVVDGAARLDLLATLYDLDAERACLFIGDLEPEVAAVAPWLVPLPGPDGPFEALSTGWGGAQAIYVRSALPLAPLRRHFRTLTMVETPDRKTVFFRFYDPRVLRSVVPIFTPAQRSRLFGKAVAAYFCEGPDGELLSFAPEPVAVAV